MNRPIAVILTAAALMWSAAPPAPAQTAGAPPPAAVPTPPEPPAAGTVPPAAKTPGTQPVPEAGDAKKGSLSQQLSRSNGVITPPPTGDTEMTQAPPPSAVKTPVIPPPGSPGGNQEVQPK